MKARLFVAALGLAALLVGLRFDVDLDVSRFMWPQSAEDPRFEHARQLASSATSRTLLLAVEASSATAAAQASLRLETALRAEPAVEAAAEALSGAPSGDQDRLFRRVSEAIPYLLAEGPEAVDARLSEARLNEALDELEARLASPLGTLVARLAPLDPLGLVPARFEALAAGGELRVLEGRFVAKDRPIALLFLRTRASAFDGAAQAPLLAAIEATAHRLELELSMAGLHRFAVATKRSIEADIRRVGWISVLGLVLLLAGLFRSPVALLAGLTVVGSAFLLGSAAVLACFGTIFGLTLAFGSALVGVSVDFALHYLVHRASETGTSPREAMDRLAPALRLGAATTAAGFLGLVFSGNPGLTQVGVFGAVGMIGAVLAAEVFLPRLPLPPATRALRSAFAGSETWLGVLGRLPRSLVAGGGLILGALVLLSLRGVDLEHDARRLAVLPEAMKAEEAAVRALVGASEQSRFVLASAPTLDAALAIHEQVDLELRRAVETEELGGARGFSAFLPSLATQRAVAARAAESAPAVRARLERIAETRGFAPGAFEPFLQSLVRPSGPPLSPADLEGTPLEAAWKAALLQSPGRYTVVSFLRQVADPEALRARVRGIEGASYLDQSELQAELAQQFQRDGGRGLLVGLGIVVLLVFARYRRPEALLAALLPPVLAVGGTAAVLVGLGRPLDLVALTALLMIFSMGIDYGVLLAEADRRGAAELAVSVTALGLAWLSTLAGFGLLALSEHPALETIGTTAALGVSLTVLLAPLARLAIRRPS